MRLYCVFPPAVVRPLVWFALATLALAAPGTGRAAPRLVDSLAGLQLAVNAAMAGDVITVKNGVYTTTEAITVNRGGTADQPIVIVAETAGGVELGGTQGFNVVAPAAYVVIAGFNFTHASGTDTIGADTSHVRFTRCTFRCAGEGTYLSVMGDEAQVDYNEFTDKKTAGVMIAVSGSGDQIARNVWIHHNYFHDLSSSAGSSAVMIRFGLLSALGMSTGTGLVEHNLLVRCRGVGEVISNRSCGNTYRYNTFLDSPTTPFTLRLGNDCSVYGNYFRNTEGVRIYGDRHQVYSNYFEGNFIGVNLGNGDGEVADGALPEKVHDRPDNCVIAFNTFIDNKTNFQLSSRKANALGATNTTFANNIIMGDGVVARMAGPYTGAVWSGNLLWNTGEAGDLPAEGYTKADPLLVAGPDGIKRLQAGSPAIEAATGAFPAVAFDLDGQARPEKKSIGADELSTEPALAHFLAVTDVGPDER